MRPQTHLPASRIARFSRLLLDSPRNSSCGAGVIGGVALSLRRLVALGMALLLLVPGELFAQRAPYNGQYVPYQQSGYGEPGYVQAQAYAPQPYTQSYPQQPYAPPPYPQQPYPQKSYPVSDQAFPQQGYGQAQPLNAQQLEQLVAPIALYPDTLVAQLLTAATYPGQVVDADRWRQGQDYAYSDQIAAGADVHPGTRA